LAILWLGLAGAAATSSYLAALAAAAFIRPRPAGRTPGRTRFAVIVPAHNEEAMLTKTLRSIFAQAYPRELYSVHVIADNCSDRTAALASELGAVTHGRTDPANPGKGQAIAWLLPQLTPDHDATVFIDADSTIDEHFLEAFDRRFQAGADVLQASYRVADPQSAPLVTLRALAFSLMHEVRGRGKARLGLSVGIWGNGFAMSRRVLERFGWSSFSGTEDAEQHIQLVLNGVRVTFAPEAKVYGHMPASFKAAQSQQRRWEAGRLTLLRRYWLRLVRATVLRANPSAGVALIDVALPPLSIIVAGDCAIFGLVLLFGNAKQVLLASMVIIGLGVYIGAGFYFARLPLRAFLALRQAPSYVLWKLWLYALELPRRKDPTWIRTSRDPSVHTAVVQKTDG
jgi:cellulose synthase/poly-beta-1,6-N-acetylglucosamine synthase-like glycosyltransferase